MDWRQVEEEVMASEGDSTLNAVFGQRREGETAQEFDLTPSPRLPISPIPLHAEVGIPGRASALLTLVREGGGKGFMMMMASGAMQWTRRAALLLVLR